MSPRTLEGEVRGLHQSTENRKHKVLNEEIQEQVWKFQVDRYEEGKQLPSIPVEMRGESISGVLSEGHLVRLNIESWHEGQTLLANEVYNLTLSTPVVALQPDYRYRVLIAVIIVLAFIIFAVLAYRAVVN